MVNKFDLLISPSDPQPSPPTYTQKCSMERECALTDALMRVILVPEWRIVCH